MAQQQAPEVYKVDWIGTNNTSLVYSRVFATQPEAIAFQKTVKDSLVFRLSKESEDAFQWQIVPTVTGQELIRVINMRRDLEQKGKLINREGISSIAFTTVPQFQKSQRARLIGILAIGGLIGWTVYKHRELPLWLRGAMIGVGAVSIYVNGRNYISNAKYQKK